MTAYEMRISDWSSDVCSSDLILTDLAADQLLSIADLARDKGILIFNVGATDDRLREADCRANVFHTIPTRSMLADGLAQYLIWKQWQIGRASCRERGC